MCLPRSLKNLSNMPTVFKHDCHVREVLRERRKNIIAVVVRTN